VRDENLREGFGVGGNVKEERKPRPVVSLMFPPTPYNCPRLFIAAKADSIRVEWI
jgi:hypothetical protein